MSSHRCCCPGNYALGKSAAHSLHDDQPERGRGPTELSWVVFIPLLHTIKHACLHTINSKEDKWRSLINSIWHRSERRRWQRACRFLDTLSKSRRLVLPSEPCKLRSDPTLVKEPPSKLRYRYSLHALTHLRMHCQRIEVNLGALAGLSLVAIVVLSSRRKGQVGSLNGNASSPWKVPDYRCHARIHPFGYLGARNCRPEKVHRAAIHRGCEYQERIAFATRRVPYVARWEFT